MRCEIFRLCRNLRPTILHSRNLSGLDALLPARLAGVAYCVHGEHGWDVDNLDGWKLKPMLLRRLHSPLVKRYITVSKDMERFLVNRVGISAARTSQVYNGVDTDRFTPSPLKSFDLLPPEFRSDGLIRIGIVGRIQPIKDHGTLLRAFSLLVMNRPDLRNRLRLTIVGDGPALANMRMLADSLRITPLTWFSGTLDNIPDVFRGLDVFVLPSLNEGISNTILEAMASGLPVVATRVGGNPELVVDGETGLLVPPSDPVAVAEAILSYLKDPAKLRRHGDAGRKRAELHFSMEKMVNGYLAVYDSVLNRKILSRQSLARTSQENGMKTRTSAEMGEKF